MLKFLINSSLKYRMMLLSLTKVYALIPVILIGLVALTFGLAYSFLPLEHSVIINEGLSMTDEITVVKNGG